MIAKRPRSGVILVSTILALAWSLGGGYGLGGSTSGAWAGGTLPTFIHGTVIPTPSATPSATETPTLTPLPTTTPAAEGCCEEHSAPGCNTTACEDCVCGIVPECCTTQWDTTCLFVAFKVCGGQCGCTDGTPTPTLSPTPSPTATATETPAPIETPTSTIPATPTATVTSTPTTVPTPEPLNHFLCYESHQAPVNRPGVSLRDQFDDPQGPPSTVTVKKAKRLCAPADKEGEDSTAPDDLAHLTAYTIKQTTKFERRGPI